MCNWGFAISDAMKRGDATAKWAREHAACGHFIGLLTYVETHIRTSCPWGFDISDVMKRHRHEYLWHAAFSFIALHVLKPTSGPRARRVSIFPTGLNVGDATKHGSARDKGDAVTCCDLAPPLVGCADFLGQGSGS